MGNSAGNSNFVILRSYQAQLWRLGALAERYFADDPNTCLLKLRQFAELLAQALAARTGLYQSPDEARTETQLDLLRRLRGSGVLPNEPYQMFDAVRRFGPVPTLIEWDASIPEFTVLEGEAARASEIQARELEAEDTDASTNRVASI